MSAGRGIKEDMHYWIMLGAGAIWTVLLLDWTMRFFPDKMNNGIILYLDRNFIVPMLGSLVWLRMGYVLCIAAHFWLYPYRKEIGTNRPILLLTTGFTCIFFLAGYTGIDVYDLLSFPFLSMAVFALIMLSSSFLKTAFRKEDVFGISNEPELYDNKFVYATDQGTLGIHSVEQHIMVQGGSGAGKGGSIIEPSVLQHMEKGYPAVIYDAKADLPLTRTAYTCKLHLMEKGTAKDHPFYVFDISDPRHSYRINVLDQAYVGKENFGLVVEIMSAFLKNLNPQWNGQNAKLDHWYEAALAVWTSLCMRFLEDGELREELSFPLLTEMIMSTRVGKVLSFIEETPMAKKMLSPIYLSSQGNMRQFTSEFSSAMSGLNKVVADKNLYWLLSKNELDLNMNTEGREATICIGGNLAATESYTPFVATILNLVMEYMRSPKGNPVPSMLLLDEIYTIYLEHLPRDANVVRSNKVCIMMGIQAYSMLEDKYGVKKANNLFAACGNQFYGMSNETQSAEILEKMLGMHNVVHTSVSSGDSGESDTQSLKEKKVMGIREITSQPRGHFTGKVANGRPPFFSAQFKRFKLADDILPLPEFVQDAYSRDSEGKSGRTLQGQIDRNFQLIAELADQILSKYPDKLAEEPHYAGQD